jgi:hypothetical protein
MQCRTFEADPGLRDGQILTGRISVTNNDPQQAALFGIRDDVGEREVQFFPKGRPMQAWQYQVVDCSNGRWRADITRRRATSTRSGHLSQLLDPPEPFANAVPTREI